MSSATSPASPLPATPLTRSRSLGIAVVASVAHMLLMIPGYNEDGEFQTGEFAVIFVISLAVAVALFMFVVPGAGAVTALVLAVVGLISVVVFWAGVTLPLAAAAAMSGWNARAVGVRTGLATMAIVLAVLTAIALVVIIIGDATAN